MSVIEHLQSPAGILTFVLLGCDRYVKEEGTATDVPRWSRTAASPQPASR